MLKDLSYLVIYGDAMHIRKDFFECMLQNYPEGTQLPIFGLGGLYNPHTAIQSVTNPSKGVYIVDGGQFDKRGLFQECAIVSKDEWGNPKYLCKMENISSNSCAFYVYERKFDPQNGIYYGGELRNLEGDDHIIYNLLVPTHEGMPLMAGDVLNPDYTITRADGDVIAPNGEIIS